MEIIMRTKFQPVNYDINWQPQTREKGKNLALAGHVKKVEELRKNGKSYLIKAAVMRQTSISDSNYLVQLFISDTYVNTDAEDDVSFRKVDNVTCTCVYNQTQKCKHVAALIWYINNERSLTKTDHEQQWGAPSKKESSKEKYAKGKTFKAMFGEKRHKRRYARKFVQPSAADLKLEEMNSVSPLRRLRTAESADMTDFEVQSYLTCVKKVLTIASKNDNVKP